MKWSFLVLDFDQIYDLEPEEEKGVEPAVFLINDDDLLLAKACVEQISDRFFDDDLLDKRTLTEIFVDMLCQKKIRYHYIGSINLTFGERRNPDYILPEVSLCLA